MIEKFSESALNVLRSARILAEQYNSEYVEVAHIVIVVLSLEDGVIIRILKDLGMSINEVLAGVKQTIPHEKHVLVCGELPLSPEAR